MHLRFFVIRSVSCDFGKNIWVGVLPGVNNFLRSGGWGYGKMGLSKTAVVFYVASVGSGG